MNYIIVTGGAGFIGTNLIRSLLKLKEYKIISIDNYFTGQKSNHIKAKNLIYLRGNTINISKILDHIKNQISAVFHFAEFSRIAQSFDNINRCFQSNLHGSYEVVNFCMVNKIKIIYSATSASLGNKGLDKNLSPYAFTKSNNMNLIMNFNEWFGLKYEIVYFYNVYGPNQIYKSNMAAVVGIFEEYFKKNEPLPVVKPGSQSRKFTHVQDTVEACIYAWKKNRNSHYSISHNTSYSIIQLAKLFSNKIKMIPERRGERFNSSIVKVIRNKKISNLVGKRSLHKYVKELKKNNI